jgi:selenocysteine lyase/cysteine desulfurase
LSDQENPNDTEDQSDSLEEEGTEHEETEPEPDDSEEVEPSDEQDENSTGEQAGEAPTTPVATPPGAATSPTNAQKITWKEDPLDFDESTVEIAVTLHPLKGRPADERIVTICIHNHSGSPLYDSARQSELTEGSALDRLQGWIAKNVKKFRTELSRRKQQQWEAEQERKQSKSRARTTAAPRSAVLATTVPGASTVNATLNKEGAASSSAGTSATPSQAHVPATPSNNDKTAKAVPGKQGEPELVQNSLF